MQTELKLEYSTYLTHLDELTQKHLNEYVLIKNKNIVSFHKSYEDALESGLQKFGNVPFFIKVVKKEEEVYHFYHGIE